MEAENINFKIIECVCSWYDLLGFGQPLMESAWDLTDERCKKQLKRITDLDLSFSNRYSSAHGTTNFSLNDSVISNFDIYAIKYKTLERLVLVIDDLVLEYEMLNALDVKAGFPGMRGVITYGHRYDYTYAESTLSVLNKQTVAYHPKVFQMNTAFSKAYIMESSGSKAGISGNSLYVDNDLLAFLEKLSMSKGDENSRFRIEKDLLDESETKIFSIFRDEEVFLSLYFDKIAVKYNNKGIETKLFKFQKRVSRQDQLAQEAEFQRTQRYLQMEQNEFDED